MTPVVLMGLAILVIVLLSAVVRTVGTMPPRCPDCDKRNVQALKSDVVNPNSPSYRHHKGAELTLAAESADEIAELWVTRYRCRACEHQWEDQKIERTYLRNQRSN